MSFTGFTFYIAVRCGFDKHLYLTSCLNANNHNTCIRLPQTGCTARNMALFIISQDRQTQSQILAANAYKNTYVNWTVCFQKRIASSDTNGQVMRILYNYIG